VRATGLPVEKLEKMNVATEKHLQNEVDPFTYLVRPRLPTRPAGYGPIPTYPASSPQASRSVGIPLEAQESMEVCTKLYCG